MGSLYGRRVTRFEMSLDFMIQQHIKRLCFSSTGSVEIDFLSASNLAIKSKCNAISVERIHSKMTFLNRDSSSAYSEGHRSSMIRPIVKQCKFSKTERSLKMAARLDPEAVKNAFVTPG